MGSLLPILDLNASPNGPQSAPNSALDAAMMALKSPQNLNLKPSPTDERMETTTTPQPQQSQQPLDPSPSSRHFP
ncbi:hypothetical protein M0R45_018578 [Rubus argutus]|uniref:Uncharacterized protein n=1 Tax=Rubus argutus TaxID=59490 RepID=A0AAW1X492_RUBAR